MIHFISQSKNTEPVFIFRLSIDLILAWADCRIQYSSLFEGKFQ